MGGPEHRLTESRQFVTGQTVAHDGRRETDEKSMLTVARQI